MPSEPLDHVALSALRLQNGYGWAVDVRDWEYFATLFTSDVVATYPNARYDGMDDWLATFVPFHDACVWTKHAMSNHVVGEDSDGVWAICYGRVQWVAADTSALLHRVWTLFRDRLVEDGGHWRIAQRRLDVVMREADVEVSAGCELPESILGLSQTVKW